MLLKLYLNCWKKENVSFKLFKKNKWKKKKIIKTLFLSWIRIRIKIKWILIKTINNYTWKSLESWNTSIGGAKETSAKMLIFLSEIDQFKINQSHKTIKLYPLIMVTKYVNKRIFSYVHCKNIWIIINLNLFKKIHAWRIRMQ